MKKDWEGTIGKKTALGCCILMGIVGLGVGIYIGTYYSSLDKNLFKACVKSVQECGGSATYYTDKGVSVHIMAQEALKTL